MRIRNLAISTVVATALFVGCQSRTSRVDTLQAEYDRLGNQFVKDCQAEYYKVPPKLSPKCAEEDRQKTEAWKKLQAEREKQ